ncbi:hypothetical protein ElyMa_000374000 [Elysia marginata]|uniref:Uncharacterized protein n=1 Tax=Elysia marginata TaxID=1093978 RepID=A0AAV4FHA3_9GAST|nr:hypothetical protein ElyMa_000374000 [Elysia marginata]
MVIELSAKTMYRHASHNQFLDALNDDATAAARATGHRYPPRDCAPQTEIKEKATRLDNHNAIGTSGLRMKDVCQRRLDNPVI